MHEVDTAVWRCSAQKKPPLHAHRPATTCEVTCEGAIENPTASERSAKSRSLTRTKFEIAKSCRVRSKLENWEMVENCVESHQKDADRRRCCSGDPNKNSGMCRVHIKTQEDADRRRCCSGDPNKTRECVEFTSKLNDEKLPDPVKCELKKV